MIPSTSPAGSVRTGLYVLVVLTLGAYLPSPLLPGYQHDFGFSDLTTTLIYATFALVSAPALLVLGPATDVVGPRAVLRASLIAGAAGSLCFALASGPLWLAAGRAAQGIALGAATSAAGALISRHSRRGPLLSSTAFVAGTAAGPIVGGILAQHAPAPRVLPYLLHLALLTYAWLRVTALTPPRDENPGFHHVENPGFRATNAGVFDASALSGVVRLRIPAGVRRVFWFSAASGFSAWAAVGLFLSVIPVLLDRAGQRDPAVSGCVVGSVLLCSIAAQPLVPRLGAVRAQRRGLAAVFASLVVLALSSGGSVVLTAIAAVAAGAGHGLAYGGAAAAVESAAPAERRGAITGALYLAFYLGAGCPAIAVGLITLGHPLETAMSWVTAVAAAFVLVTAFIGKSLTEASATWQHQRDASGHSGSHFTSAERGGGRGPGPRSRGRRGDGAARPVLRRRPPRTVPGGRAGAGGTAPEQRRHGPGDAAADGARRGGVAGRAGASGDPAEPAGA
ncbi:MFS transporter [Saccharopolyspora flava]|uniref:Predicted arabinose efflux permease, MFS family n=1 Tax=Saccharopolyspora flava TaxID=95161 RepID=A0A1I6T9A2_9PSEU|nr:Predicted arabinose efflux permease, MFS family [Saccharopolyspora flava]